MKDCQVTIKGHTRFKAHNSNQTLKLLTVTGLDIYEPLYTRKPEQQRFTSKLAYRPPLAVSRTVQLMVAYCPSEWTCSLQLDRPTCAPASRTVAFIPQCSLAMTRYFLVVTRN